MTRLSAPALVSTALPNKKNYPVRQATERQRAQNSRQTESLGGRDGLQ
jgi:hypothetical protein